MKLECCVCHEKLGDGVGQVTSTKCGHLFHKECINSWLAVAVNGTCPHCRAGVQADHLRNIYFSSVSNRDSGIFNSSVVANLRDVQEDLCIMQTNLEHQIEHLKSDKEALVEQIDGLKTENRALTRANVCSNDTIDILKAQTENQGNEIKKLKEQINALTEENKELKVRSANTRPKFASADSNTPKRPVTRQHKTLREPTDNKAPKALTTRRVIPAKSTKTITISDSK